MAKSSKQLKEELKKLEEETAKAENKEAKKAIDTSQGESEHQIRLVRFYQSVQFEKEKIVTQFSYNDKYFNSKKNMKMWFDHKLMGVFVQSSADKIFVPLANTRFIQFFTDETKEKAVKDRKALG